MTNWIKVVNVHAVLDEHIGDKEAEEVDISAVSTALVELLDRELPNYMDDYGESLRELAEFGNEDDASWDDLEYELNGLYDYADNSKIWMGFGIKKGEENAQL